MLIPPFSVRVRLGGIGSIYMQISLFENLLIFGESHQKLSALNLNTMQKEWQISTESNWCAVFTISGPEHRIYMGCFRRPLTFCAFDVYTGEPVWKVVNSA